MTHKSRTGWLRFGRTGDTVDGRVIDDQAIIDAAGSYDPEFYTALIWPDHHRWFNLGKVVAVRAEKNDEGGMDLFGQIEANDIYRNIRAAGQRMFTSMELFPNFRETGKFYLSGLGATDNPASVATSEVHLSRVDDKSVLVANYYEADTYDFDDDDADSDALRLFDRFTSFFNKQNDEDDMSKKEMEALQSEIKALTEKFNAALAAKPETPADTETDRYSKLEQQIAVLTEQTAAFKSEKPEDSGSTVSVEEFSQFKESLDALTEKFNAALDEQPGTDGGEHEGDSEDLNAYI